MNNYQFTSGNWCWEYQRYCVYADSLSGRCMGNVNCPHETINVAWNRTLTDEELEKLKARLEK